MMSPVESTLTPLRTCVWRVGPRYWRWYCWRCRTTCSAFVVRRDTAIRRLDEHVHEAHGKIA